MQELLQMDAYWYWWMAACVLLLLEMILPDIFFLAMAIASGLVGLLVLLVPGLSFSWQFFSFSTISIFGLVLSRIYLNAIPPETDQPFLNQRAEQFNGRIFTLTAPIEDGVGEIKADGSFWDVYGPDCPAGTRIKVVGSSGIILNVKPVETVQG
ncbi:NfeD family protein [Candidatus Venteria ishoeyi]|uniref:Inner membrane protein YbbJ n=1 Tax=Candidatus Venteria ishoeyi TaxID=1899563 RepID=A0A1H6FE66_9GAMM|nr:NfeD family protein [Candidatus Venteria ishoeyi]MDM8547086.1 NfeD family protein [Candidatus Venteria ishoeyi]SEH07701.1 Inner membrane protein YbbJ [Candidatus Venteria ishoeyi]